MGMEAFAEVSRLLVPDWHVAALEDVDFRAPVKFYRDEPRTLTLVARIRPDGPDLLAECRLEAERQLPGSEEPQRTLHFTGSVRLSGQPPEREREEPVTQAADAPVVGAEQIYRLYFHGPAFRVVDRAWRDADTAVGRLAAHLPTAQQPPAAKTVLNPRLEELGFQVAGLWEAGREDRLALPAHVDRLRVVGTVAGEEPEGALALAHPIPSRPGAFDCEVLTPDGDVLLRLEGYRTVALPTALPDDVRGPLHDAMNGRE
jgi:hypothetical protein